MVETIVALDVRSAADAERLLDRLPEARWVKVGSILMTREGPGFVRRLTGRGLRVFLDLKWHDIPNTVAGAVLAARELGVAMATVHTMGGPAMLEAASRAGEGAVALVGVTVLTSHDAASYDRATGRQGTDLDAEVLRLAARATEAGLQGVVCSPREAGPVRRALGPGPLIVVPGVRRAADAAGDQVRIATPAEAVASGATHLVVGRPILDSDDPAAAFRGFVAEGAGGFHQR
jgi:orotidine-5'-phosphate decarboxylase